MGEGERTSGVAARIACAVRSYSDGSSSNDYWYSGKTESEPETSMLQGTERQRSSVVEKVSVRPVQGQ